MNAKESKKSAAKTKLCFEIFSFLPLSFNALPPLSSCSAIYVLRLYFRHVRRGGAQHKALSQNLIRVLAEKNMQLNEKAGFLSQRTTREKLLAYLSAQARRAGSASFRIPFDRQQLADFLSVNRSAMSAELSRMQRDGLLRADRSSFTLCQPE